jgi:2',3'-cyclic-nucleotide 2'-phosphodiesterase (5'-nucleotidase family)
MDGGNVGSAPRLPGQEGKMADDPLGAPLQVALSRRLLLGVGAGLAAAAVSGVSPFGAALAQAPMPAADLRLVVITDLHSPYATLAQLLEAIGQRLNGGDPARTLVLVNGDCFERGNVAALRSGGEVDWAFLAKLRRFGSVVLNLGNHEVALADDLADTVARARTLGLQVISNIIDRRTNLPFAPAAARFTLAGRNVGVIAVATDQLATYRQPARATLAIPKPAEYAASVMPGLFAGVDLPIILSHAGIGEDRRLLPLLPANAFLIGGHDHLNVMTSPSQGPFLLHAASWGTRFGHLDISLAEGEPRFSMGMTSVDRTMAAEPELATLIARTLEQHLTAEDRAPVGTSPRAMLLPEAAAFASEVIRQATGADVAFLSHTTLGTGLPAGPVSRYDFDAFIRFDGDIRTAEVPGRVLMDILARANQHQKALDEKTGDFVYARTLAVDPAATYRIAAIGWVAMNQGLYLGTKDLAFTPAPGLRLKAVVAGALRG